MADINVQLVREFFEFNLFHVLTNWKQVAQFERGTEYAPHLFVENCSGNSEPIMEDTLPFLLPVGYISRIMRAVVHIRAWHTDRVYPSVIESSPAFSRFRAPDVLAVGNEFFQGLPFKTILVISEFPRRRPGINEDIVSQAMRLLKERGVDHVIEFPTILIELLNYINVQNNYVASATLQTLRLLKRYDFIRNQQLEFEFPFDPPVPPRPPDIEVVSCEPDEDE